MPHLRSSRALLPRGRSPYPWGLAEVARGTDPGGFQSRARLSASAEPLTVPAVTAAPSTPIVVVSGLPRSGTSLMMQMLAAGGVPPLTDEIRTPDPDNPRGYLEFERVKQLKADATWLAEASGKAVKIIHLLLMDLPDTQRYDVVFMERDLSEVISSQAAMLARSGRPGAALPADRLAAMYETQLRTVRQWLASRSHFRVEFVQYSSLVADPVQNAERIQQFLARPLHTAAMAAAVDPALYRNRRC